MKTIYIILALALLVASGLNSDSIESSLKKLRSSQEYVDLTAIKGLKYDLRYASENNFLKQNMYKKFNRPFLHKIAAQKLARAVALLKEHNPALNLLVYDALRPRSVQNILWNGVRGTEQQIYVANPTRGSIHNFGFAVDLTIVNKSGQELDMGTGFDDFTKLAQPRLEKKFLKSGKLSAAQHRNRLLLRKIMTAAGFTQLSIEWWHFDALPGKVVRKKYKIIE